MGGAITKRDRPVLSQIPTVQFADEPVRGVEVLDERTPIYNKSAWLTPSPFGLPVDLAYRASQTPACDLNPKFMRDEHVLQNLKAMTKGKKTREHHPAVQQAVVKSLTPYPELLEHYMHS